MKKIILETVKTLDGSACLQYTFKEAAADRVSLDMLINADIPGFIKPECSRYDSEILLRWQIGRLTPLKDYLSVGKRGDLYNLLRSLCSALLSADNFFLESNPILFDPDFIFYDPSRKETKLICIPENGLDCHGCCPAASARVGILGLLSEITESDYESGIPGPAVSSPEEPEQDRSRPYSGLRGSIALPSVILTEAEKAAALLVSSTGFSPSEFSAALVGLANPGDQEVPGYCSDRFPELKCTPAGSSGSGQGETVRFYEEGKSGADVFSEKNGGKRSATAGFFSAKGFRELLKSIKMNRNAGGAVSGRSRPVPEAYILPLNGEAPAVIRKTPFIIGKAPGVDYRVFGNASVSRKHAEITFGPGGFRIKDYGSTNGTFLNGEQLDHKQRYRLKSGDRILMGSHCMTFGTGCIDDPE